MLWDDENGEGATIGGGEREGEGEEPMERTVEQAWYGTMDFEIFQKGPIYWENGVRGRGNAVGWWRWRGGDSWKQRVRRRGGRWAKGKGPMERTVEQAWYGTMDFEIFQNGLICWGNGVK